MNPDQIAQEYQLGALIDSFGWHRSWAKFYLIFSLFMLPFALLFSFLIIGIPVLVFCLFGIYSSICRLCSGKVVFLYEHGLIDRRKRRPRVIRYDEIHSLKTYIAKQYLKGIVYLWTHFIYTVELRNGNKIIFNHGLQSVERLGTIVGDKIVEQKLPAAIATFQQGQPLHFGKLTLTQSGLAAGKNLLPWSELGSIYILPSEYGPSLSIYSTQIDREGNLKQWKWFRLENVINIPLLLAMADWVCNANADMNATTDIVFPSPLPLES